MKKTIALLLIMVLLLSMVACRHEEEQPKKYCWNCGAGISTTVSFCGACGAAVQNQQQPSDDSVNTDVSATEPGTTPAPTHTHSYATTITAATCTEGGYTMHICSCGDTYTDKLTAPKGHNYTQTITPPTCTSSGYTTYTCTCGHAYTGNQTAATGHHYTQQVTPPTCVEEGYTTHTCACGDTYKSNYVAPSHSYSNYRCTKCEAVDKSHAYDYLEVWVKENGHTAGEYVEFEYVADDCTYGISYSAQGDYLFVYRNDERTYASLALDIYYYGCTFFGDYSEIEMCGFLSPSTFTYNTALTHTTYTGSASKQPAMAELARTEVCDLITWLDWCLSTYYIGLTIADLGLTAF